MGMQANIPPTCPRVLRLLLLVLMIGIFTAPLTGCGRKAQPEPPPGTDFPRTYPSR